MGYEIKLQSKNPAKVFKFSVFKKFIDNNMHSSSTGMQNCILVKCNTGYCNCCNAKFKVRADNPTLDIVGDLTADQVMLYDQIAIASEF